MRLKSITADQQRAANAKRDAQVALGCSSETEILVNVLNAVTLSDIGEAFPENLDLCADVYADVKALDGLSSVKQSAVLLNNKNLCKLAQFKLQQLANTISILAK